jgi:hypothetical protein
MRLYSCLILWSLCMGHVENKKRCAPAIKYVVPQLETLRTDTDELFDARKTLYKYTAMLIWSVSYGIPDNKHAVVDAGGVELLALLLKHHLADFSLRHSAAGALWHLCELSHTCEALTADTVALQALVKTATEVGPPANQIIVGCLALSSLANYSDASANAVRDAGGFKALVKFTRSLDATTYETSFVWTTVKPLMDLITSKYPEVVELGCFLSYTVCDKGDIPKLFNEGVVGTLKSIVSKGRENPENYLQSSKLAKLTLTNLEISTDDIENNLKASSTSLSTSTSIQPLADPIQDLSSWLSALGLQDHAHVFTTHKIEFEDLVLLQDADVDSFDLPLGPKRRLQNALLSLRRGRGLVAAAAAPEASSSTGSCLICFDAPKDTVLVPCGHVATCEQCAQILRARKDKCVICRTPVERIVKPFYV